MRIVNLIEDTPGVDGCRYEHGLSFYIETPGHRLLMDAGASGAFLENAGKLGIDLSAVDTLVLSHGHNDHGGGILEFARINPTAKIYMQEGAMEPHYTLRTDPPNDIGLDAEIAKLPQAVFVKDDLAIDGELSLFAGVTGRKLWPDGNRLLKRGSADALVQDDFAHEQYLAIQCEGRRVLISGCAHNGILNILERYEELWGCWPDVVVSGFHMMRRGDYTDDDRRLVRELACELRKHPTRFCTGHCTGEEPYAILKEIMGDQVEYVHSGEEISL